MIKELQTCLLCKQPSLLLSHFYRNHRIKLEDYCLKYFNKKDLFDGRPLSFKSVESYFGIDFANKVNLKRYLKGLSKELVAVYCKNLLVRRKEHKELVFTPLQIELLSLSCFPPVHYLIDLFDYYGFCNQIGLINKMRTISDFSLNLNQPAPDSYIIIDSRESDPLKFEGIEYRVDKLDYGDYHCPWNPNLYFERKSIQDLYSSLSGDLERFKRELIRCRDANAYLVVIVEQPMSKVVSFPYIPFYRSRIKATSEFIFYNMRELIQEFSNIQFIFVKDRFESSRIMSLLFRCNLIYNQFDLQLLYDLKKL